MTSFLQSPISSCPPLNGIILVFQAMEQNTNTEKGGLVGQGDGYRALNLSRETIIVPEEYYENRAGDLAAFVPVSVQ